MAKWVNVGLMAVLAAACSGGAEAGPATVAGVGDLPGVVATISIVAVPDATSTTVARGVQPVRPADLGEPTIAEISTGNRVMVIGDSITASTAPRFGGSMCEVLTEAGWFVEINAEPGRFVTFADTVLDARLNLGGDDDWDAAVLFLGSNYDGDRARFSALYNDALDRLAPRPVVVLTVSEFAASRIEVNEVIRAAAQERDAVQLIDWAVITENEPGLLARDGLHLSSAGGSRLVTEVALALGPAVVTTVESRCAPTLFTDDEVGSGDDEDL